MSSSKYLGILNLPSLNTFSARSIEAGDRVRVGGFSSDLQNLFAAEGTSDLSQYLAVDHSAKPRTGIALVRFEKVGVL